MPANKLILGQTAPAGMELWDPFPIRVYSRDLQRTDRRNVPANDANFREWAQAKRKAITL
jgi:hypothetical protein